MSSVFFFKRIKLQFIAPQARQPFAVRKNLRLRNKVAIPVARFLRTAPPKVVPLQSYY